MQCFRGIIVSSDAKLIAELESAAFQVTSALSFRKIANPAESELEAVIQLYDPSVVFLDMADPLAAMQLADQIQSQAHCIQIIGVADNPTNEMVLGAVRSGMRDVLGRPLTVSDLHRIVVRLIKLMGGGAIQPKYRQELISFLPAKVGSGASTLAVHTAFSLSRSPGARTALMDFDFDCGVVDFMLKLSYSHGISDMAEYGPQMDDAVWARAVTKVGNLDVLRAGHAQTRVNATHAEYLLRHAQRSYDLLCVDLPGTMDESTMHVLQQSNSILLVCTPELSSVHLARRRLDTLRRYRLGDRVRVVYNRRTPGALLTKEAVQDVLGAELYAVVDNDYETLQKALMNGRPVDSDTPLGRNFSELADKIMGVQSRLRREKEQSFWAALRNLFTSSKRLPEPQAKTAAQLPPCQHPVLGELLGAAESKALIPLKAAKAKEAALTLPMDWVDRVQGNH